jgi:hypothetical protein
MCRRCSALHELGLTAGATDAEVKTAYRLYVMAWHPDRFPGDEKSKSAAQEKLKAINSSYSYLTSSPRKSQPCRPKTDAPPPRPPEPPPPKQGTARQPSAAGGGSHTPPPGGRDTGGQAPTPSASAPRRWGISVGSGVRDWGHLLLWLGIFVGLIAWWGAASTPSNRSSQPTPSDSAGVTGVPPGLTAEPIVSPSQPVFSLPNGTEIRKRRHLNGRGELTVENGTLDDAVIHVVDLQTGKTIRTFYVKTDNTFTEKQISPGEYGVYFSTGIDWNVELKSFNLNASYSRFGANLEYTERMDEVTGKIETVTYKISLQPVHDGNAKIEPSDKDAFDKMMNDGTTD